MSKVQPTADYWTNDVKSTPRCRLLNRWPKKPGDEIVLFLLSRKTKSSLPPLRVWKYFEYLECVIHLDLQNSSYLMYQSIPKPPIPSGQSLGIWLALSSVEWGIWPKMRPARWGLTFVSKRLSAVGSKILWFSRWAAFTDHCSCRFHVGFSFVVVLYSSIVEYAFV